MKPLTFSRLAIPISSPLSGEIVASSKTNPGVSNVPSVSSLRNNDVSITESDLEPGSLAPTTSTMVHTKRALSPLAPLSISPAPSKALRSPLPLPRFLTLDTQTLFKKFISINAYERELQLLGNTDGEVLAQDRYSDIKPWDHNRVKLSEIPGLTWRYQYINASPVKLGREKDAFIATQGPPDNETAATQFWRMVWQENAEIVIMLTKTEEAGRAKCSVYWPENKGDVKVLKVGEDEYTASLTSGLEEDDMKPKKEPWGRVECIDIQNQCGCELRILKLVQRVQEVTNQEAGEETVADCTSSENMEATFKEESRIIHHYFFQAWPDHDVPKTADDQKALLELIHASRFRINQSTERGGNDGEHTQTLAPRIVHCSAGVGRTGTFIALDYFLQELEEGKLDKYVADPEADPIFDIVKQMRHQRTYMVQKHSQYALIYQILKDKWEERATRLANTTSNDDEMGTDNGKISKDDEDLESPLKKRKVW